MRVRIDEARRDDQLRSVDLFLATLGDLADSDYAIAVDRNVAAKTHYDAQICWVQMISCTSWHGVTSVVMGNCGVGVAPCKPDNREITAWDLTNVEAIPYNSLAKGVTWDWETFPEFMGAAERRGSAINLGFLAPLTPFRHYVMGKESMERAATVEKPGRFPH